MKLDVTVANGAIEIPEDVRQALGVRDGDVLSLETEEGMGKLVLKTRAQRLKDLQAWMRELRKDNPPFTVNDFIRDRPAMWGEDEA